MLDLTFWLSARDWNAGEVRLRLRLRMMHLQIETFVRALDGRRLVAPVTAVAYAIIHKGR